MILQRIQLLCNNALEGKAELSDELIEEFGEYCKDALRKQFTPNEKEFKIRASQIGKDIRAQQCELLKCEKDEPFPYNLILKFLYGDILEGIVMTLLKASGVKIQDEQKAVSLPIGGVDLEGTYDVKINDKIYDIKSASDFMYNNKFSLGFNHVEEVDTFGYVTQLYIYAEAENCKVGGWIVINKTTGEIQVVETPLVDNKFRKKHLKLAEQNIKTLLNTKSLDDVDKTLPTEPEKFSNKLTGRKVLHSDYKYFDYKKTLWGDKIEYKPNPKSKAKSNPHKWYVKEGN